MFYKLAFQNVKKSFKDYTIYFLTLTFGVCLFYIFNSLESQQVMLALSASQSGRNMVELLINMISGISIFVAVILGFLIIYANRFLMKRRKKELGLYMVLGMPKFEISRILTVETFVIGVLSLATGLLIGAFASQGLSVLTAQLFEVRLDEFQFVFSTSALLQTILYFGVIFLTVILFNGITVSKFKLIDLLTAAKKNETLRVKSLWLSVVLFLLSVACLGTAYKMVIEQGLAVWDTRLLICIILGIIGTFLFFLSLSGFLLRAVKSCKRLYYKGLNMFVLRQINAKVTTAFISMSLICLMLFVTICVFSAGAGLADTQAQSLKNITPYDASAYTFFGNEDPEYIAQGNDLRGSFAAQMEESGALAEDIVQDYAVLDIYDIGATYRQLLTYYEPWGGTYSLEGQTLESVYETYVETISLSDYNTGLALQGEKPLQLKDNEVALCCNFDELTDAYRALVGSGDTITLENETFTFYPQVIESGYCTTPTAVMTGTLIVPDRLVANQKLPEMEYVNVQLKGDKEANSPVFEERAESAMYQTGFINVDTKVEVYAQSKGMTLIVTYIAIYIGIVFLITSAAVLALQQLSESSDNQQRYRLLRKIGTDPKMINRSIFMQVFITFVLPLLLAVIHSAVGIYVSNDVIKLFGHVDASAGIFTASVTILLVYGGYMVATYLGCKSMLRKK